MVLQVGGAGRTTVVGEGETRAGPTPLDRVSRWLFPIAYVAAVGISLAGWLSRGESWL